MNFTQYSEIFTAALYHQATLTGRDWITVSDLIEQYGFPWKEAWAENLFLDLEGRNLARLHGRTLPHVDQPVALTGAGFRHVEREHGDNVAVILEQHGLSYRPDASGDQVEAQPVNTSQKPTSIDSSSWTGLPKGFQLSEEKRGKLVRYLYEAESGLDKLGVGNEEKAQARAYIMAARALAEAPEPPIELIWEIIGRANSIAGIASLFVSIIALFA